MFKQLKVVGGSVLVLALLIVLAAQWLRPVSAAQGDRQIQIPPARKDQAVVIT